MCDIHWLRVWLSLPHSKPREVIKLYQSFNITDFDNDGAPNKQTMAECLVSLQYLDNGSASNKQTMAECLIAGNILKYTQFQSNHTESLFKHLVTLIEPPLYLQV